MTAIAIAQRLLALQLSVIPVPRFNGGRHDGKVPEIGGARVTTDRATATVLPTRRRA